MTRLTGVCCSMNSLTSTPHAPKPSRRHGRSRALTRNQVLIWSLIGTLIEVLSAALTGVTGPAGVVFVIRSNVGANRA